MEDLPRLRFFAGRVLRDFSFEFFLNLSDHALIIKARIRNGGAPAVPSGPGTHVSGRSSTAGINTKCSFGNWIRQLSAEWSSRKVLFEWPALSAAPLRRPRLHLSLFRIT